MGVARQSKSSEIASDSLLIAGIQKHLAGVSVIVNGTTYAGADLAKQVQTRLDAVNATIANRAAWQNTVKAEAEALVQTQLFLNALKRAIFSMFVDIATLADFGLAPHKKPVIAPAERVAMAAKARATRAARHTMGSKQKKAITGSVASGAGGSSPAATATTPSVGVPVALGAPAATALSNGTPRA